MNLNDLLNDQNRILRLKEVLILTGLSRTMLYDLQAKDEFPKSVKLARCGRAMGWRYKDVINWIDTRVGA